MERLNARKESVKKALDKFGHTLQKFETKDNQFIEYDELRDSLIQRFEFSVDTFWKFLMLYITDDLKVIIEQASPKQVFQKALELKLLTPNEYTQCVKMIDDRNLTSHTYNEKLAQAISKNLPDYYKALHAAFNRLEQ